MYTEPPLSAAGQRMRQLAEERSISEETWWVSYRFVREVERIEREGRVKSRTALEMRLGIKAGTISQIRAGRNDASTGMINKLRRIFNADRDFILDGVSNLSAAEPRFPLPGKKADDLTLFKPVIHEYKSPAGWKIGPMPEADERHYLDDPKNRLWQPHKDSPARVRARANESGGLKTENPAS